MLRVAALLSSVETQQLEVSKLSPDQLIHRIGEIIEDNMGGTIGACEHFLPSHPKDRYKFAPVFAIFFTAWSSAIKRMIHPSPTSVSSVRFMDTLSDALTSLSHHTSAKPGDRTIMDALYPLCDATLTSSGSRNVDEVGLESSTECPNGNLVAEACRRAHEGAISTRGMKPKLGRAVYVELKEGLELPPDPGAWGVAVLAKGFWAGFCEQAKES